MITTGVTGSRWRASITPWGSLEPWDDVAGLDWYVAADDRWHIPAQEPTVRQSRVDGTPVTETRVRVPSGDVVQRVFSVADGGGITVVEVENESTLPVAIAFDRSDVLTDRPIAKVPIEGIDLPADAFVMPLGHRAALRVGVVHGNQRCGPWPTAIPSARQVANGWLATTERASRFILPDGAAGADLTRRVTALRCDIALGEIPNTAVDPGDFAIALGELVRMGEAPGPWLPELVEAVEAVGPVESWEADVAVDAAQRIISIAGEERARRDLERIAGARSRHARPDDPPDGVWLVPWMETGFADGGALLPHGLAPAWLGQSLEVYGVPTAAGSSVSYALRWHGDRPAVLWEQHGTPTCLTAPVVAPGWMTTEPQGEALWPAPNVDTSFA